MNQINRNNSLFHVLEKSKPIFTVGEILNNFSSLNGFIKDINSYLNKYRLWLEGTANTNKLLKNKKFYIAFFQYMHPTIIFSRNTKIHPSVFAFVVRFLSNLDIRYDPIWESALAPFKQLLHIEEKNPKWKTMEREQYKVPNFENPASAIIYGIDKKTNFHELNNIYELMDAFVEIDQSNNKKNSLKTSAASLIKYIITELIGNIQEHVADDKIHLAEVGTYSGKEHVYISFSDAGITIPKKIREFFKKKNKGTTMDDASFLRWAFEEYKTTKENSNGGRGLFDIKNIIKNLDAELIVLSNYSIGIIKKNKEEYLNSDCALNGTMFMLKIKSKSLLDNNKIIFKNKNKKILEVFND